LISSFLFWIIKDCLFLLGYISGRQSFSKPLSAEEERAALLRMREGDENARQMVIYSLVGIGVAMVFFLAGYLIPYRKRKKALEDAL